MFTAPILIIHRLFVKALQCHFSGIEYIVRIKEPFDGAHDFHAQRIMFLPHEPGLGKPDPMLSREGAPKLNDLLEEFTGCLFNTVDFFGIGAVKTDDRVEVSIARMTDRGDDEIDTSLKGPRWPGA